MGTMVIGLVVIGSARSLVPVYRGYVRNQQVLKIEQKLNTVTDVIRHDTDSFDLPSFTQLTPAKHPASDAQVEVLYTVQNIDPISRSRDVNLTATWIAGNNDANSLVRTRTFTVMKLRNSLRNAMITGTVVHPNGAPAVGINVTAPGQVLAQVSAVTNANGEYALSNVLVSKDGIYITVNGESKRNYFLNPASFHKDFKTAETKEQTTVQMPPIEIRPPGKIQGRVTMVNSSNGVPNVKIFVVQKQMIINGDYKQTAITDENGDYVFTDVITGQYWIYMLGNNSIAAHGKPAAFGYDKTTKSLLDPGDYYKFNPTNTHATVDSGSTGDALTKNFSVIKKGDVHGTVRTVRYVGGQYVVGQPLANQTFRFQRYYAFTNINSPSQGTLLDFRNTTAFRDVYFNYFDLSLSNFGPNYESYYDEDLPFTTDANGNYTVPNVGPSIVDPTQDMSLQYTTAKIGIGSFQYDNTSQKPASPIFVVLPLTSPRFAIPGWGSFEYRPAYVPPASPNFTPTLGGPVSSDGSPLTPFNNTYDDPNLDAFGHPKLFAGVDNVYDIYLLEREDGTFGNIYGEISNSDGSPFPYLGYTQAALTAEVRDIGSMNSVTPFGLSPSFWCVAPDYSTRNCFNFKYKTNFVSNYWVDYRGLIPNLDATDRTRLYFTQYGPSTMVDVYIKGSVRAYRKTQDNGKFDFEQLIPTDTNLTLAVEARHGQAWSTAFPVWWNENLSVTNGLFVTGAHSNDTYMEYLGKGVADVQPGQDTYCPITIDDSQTRQRWGGFVLRVTGGEWTQYIQETSAGEYVYTDYNSAHPANELTGMLSLYHISKANVTGVVKNAAGNPIANAVVRLMRSSTYGYIDPVYYHPDYPPLYFQTGADGRFTFSDVKFVELQGTNLNIKVTASGYIEGTDTSEAIDGFSWTRDFTLLTPAVTAIVSDGDL